MKIGNKIFTVVILALFLISFASAATIYDATLGTTDINECGEIVSSGTYNIIQDISGPLDAESRCLVISADDVTLNGNFWYIEKNTDGKYIGIYSDNGDNTLKDLTILNWDYAENNDDIGIHLDNEGSNTLDDVIIYNFHHGIELASGSEENTLNNIIINGGNIGIYAISSSYNILRDIKTINTDWDGIQFNLDPSNLVSEENIFEEINSGSNGRYGLALYGSSDNEIRDSIFLGNAVSDVYLRGDSGEGSFNNKFIDTRYNTEVVDGFESSFLERYWTFSLELVNQIEPIEGASVLAKTHDVWGPSIFSGLTDVNGLIPDYELLEYSQGTSIKTDYFPVLIDIAHPDYDTVSWFINLGSVDSPDDIDFFIELYLNYAPVFTYVDDNNVEMHGTISDTFTATDDEGIVCFTLDDTSVFDID